MQIKLEIKSEGMPVDGEQQTQQQLPPGKTQAELDSDLFTKMKATERKRKPLPVVKKEEEEGEACKIHLLLSRFKTDTQFPALLQSLSQSCAAWSAS